MYVYIQRFKGLGEMMPAQLWETTMDPRTRRLRRVTLADAQESDALISALMGKNVTLRKDFIVANSVNMRAEDLDV
jgi:DNA gyrase subunit B